MAEDKSRQVGAMTNQEGRKNEARLDTIGGRLRRLRKAKELKGTALAGDIGVTQPLLSAWETGAEVPSLMRCRQLAEVLGCSLAYLVKGGTHQVSAAVVEPGKGAHAEAIAANFERRLRVALGTSMVARPAVMPLSQLPFVIEPCQRALLELDELDRGHDMMRALPTLDTIIGWAEAALDEGVPEAGRLLFDACDRAVHFKCFVALAANLIGETNGYFGKMNRIVYLEKGLHARNCARWGDVYKICSVEKPHLKELSLQLFQTAWRGEGRADGHALEYHALRSPAIVAGSLPMPRADFENYVARLNEGLERGRLLRREQVHGVEGRSETYAQRYLLTQEASYKKQALKDMEQAQRLAQNVSGKHRKHDEMWLRTERLAITLWRLGIRDHMSASGMSGEAAAAQKAVELHKHAKDVGSDRIAAAMLKEVRKSRQ